MKVYQKLCLIRESALFIHLAHKIISTSLLKLCLLQSISTQATTFSYGGCLFCLRKHCGSSKYDHRFGHKNSCHSWSLQTQVMKPKMVKFGMTRLECMLHDKDHTITTPLQSWLNSNKNKTMFKQLLFAFQINKDSVFIHTTIAWTLYSHLPATRSIAYT